MAVMPERVLEALRRGDKIEAIRRLRAVSPLGLREAKTIIDTYRGGEITLPSQPSAGTALSAGHSESTAVRVAAAKSASTERLRKASGYGLAQARDASDASRYRDHPTGIAGRSPGEVPNSGRWVWWLVVIAVAAYAAYSEFGSAVVV